MIALKFLTLIFLILCVGFFTSSETAYLSLPKLKLRSMVEENRKHAKVVVRLKNEMDRLITAVLIGTNFLNSLTSALATAMVIEFTDGKFFALTPFITAFFITTFGQIVPKTASGLYPEKFACMEAVPLYLLEKIFFPIIWLFERLSHLVVYVVEKISPPASVGITEEELQALIEVGQKEGTIEKDESKMMHKIIQFTDLLVSDIMRHRSFLSMVSEDSSHDEVVDEFLRSGVSTLIVYGMSKENVVGVLNYKKILYGKSIEVGSTEGKKVGFAKENMNSVFFVPGTLSVLEILNKFRNSEHKFAVVLNEQGETYGVVTMNDILRTVFGHIQDEENKDLMPEDKIMAVSNSKNTFRVSGDLKLEEVNEFLGLNLVSEDMNTLGGFVLEKLGFLPSIGTILEYDGNIFIVDDIFQRRIVSVRVQIGNNQKTLSEN